MIWGKGGGGVKRGTCTLYLYLQGWLLGEAQAEPGSHIKQGAGGLQNGQGTCIRIVR
jgi:hypothetical protein